MSVSELLEYGRKRHDLSTIGEKEDKIKQIIEAYFYINRNNGAAQRRNEGLPAMHCISLLFTITIFNERLAKSC
jgi:hypothetical protein